MKFLHIADIHLGCTRYQLAESPRDFFDAWMDVLYRYALGKSDTFRRSETGTAKAAALTPVDFVMICGDFFHKKSVPPETMNYAVEGLRLLKDHNIPVVMIEGNHDQRQTDSEYSWLRSLSDWDLVHLLEPGRNASVNERAGGATLTYEPWNVETKRGGYIDIGRARIFGSHWYGASGNWAIPKLIDAIRANRRDGAFHALMLHTDVEGHQTHPIPALSLSALKELKSVTDYVGLGHTHMHYEIDNWAFNPGSIEVTNISGFRETRGAFIVDVADDYTVTATHLTEYHHRPFRRITFDVTTFSDPKEVTAALLEQIERDWNSNFSDGDMVSGTLTAPVKPIVEIALRGQLGFPNSLLEMQKIRDETQKLTGALHVRIKNHSIPAELGDVGDSDEDEGREKIERRVVDLIVAKDKRFKSNIRAISDAVVGAKRMALSDDEPEKIAEFIAAQAAKV
ncbi:MAG: metallophosphoesterase family protein [Pyrinomonadaceae bacterium]